MPRHVLRIRHDGNIKRLFKVKLVLLLKDRLDVLRRANRRSQMAVHNSRILDEDHVLRVDDDALEARHLDHIILLGRLLLEK